MRSSPADRIRPAGLFARKIVICVRLDLDRSGLECYHKLNRYAHIAGGIKLSAKHTDAELECCEEHIVHTDAVMAARSAMPAEEITTAASDFFKAFSDKTRLRILAALVSAELCVCDIASLLNMSQSAISHQLRFFETGAGWSRVEKTGKNSILCAVR